MTDKSAQRTVRSIVLSSILGLSMIAMIMAISPTTGFTAMSAFLLVLISGLAIIAVPESGMHILIAATMLFAHRFTLQPLIVRDTVIKISPFDIVLFLTVVSYFLRLRPGSLAIPRRMARAWVLFTGSVVVWSALSVVWGGDPALVFSTLKNFGVYGIVFFATLAAASDREAWMRLTATIVGGGVAILGFAVTAAITGRGFDVDVTPLSTEGVRLLSAPHTLGVIFALVIVMASAAGRRERSPRHDMLTVAVSAAWIAGVILSLFRNLWLGLAAAWIVQAMFFPPDARKRLVRLSAAAGALLAIVGFFIVWVSILSSSGTAQIPIFHTGVVERLAALNPFAAHDISAQYRLAALRSAFRAYGAHVVTGIGFGASVVVDMGGWAGRVDVRELHNHYVELLVTMGPVGLGLFLYLVWAIATGARDMLRRFPQEMFFLWGHIGFITVFLIAAFFGVYFHQNTTLFFFWLSVGLLFAPYRFTAANGPKPADDTVSVSQRYV